MKFKVVFIAVLMVLMAVQVQVSEGTTKKHSTSENSKLSEDQALIERAKEAVKDMLNDPESARFKNLHIGTESNRPVRGEFNTKNDMGGYVGFERFYYSDNEGVVRCGPFTITTLIFTSGDDTPEKQAMRAKYKRYFQDGW